MKNIPLPPTSHQPKKYSGPSADEVLALRKQFMNPGIFLYYKKPLMVVEGSMQYVWDETGKRYLDGLGGIVTVSVGIASARHCCGQQTERTLPAFDDDLSAPERRAIRREARIENARRLEGGLFRELRFGGERSCAAHGARLHAELRPHRAAQCVSRRQRVRHGRHRA